MSSLAEILIRRGYTVAGSDMQESATVEHLRKFGAEVTVGQKAENVEKFAPDIIVKTDAIMDTNPELVYAKEHNIPVYRRAELLGYIIDGYKDAIGVAGTHGKTTTTSMITSVFLSAKRDASSIIGKNRSVSKLFFFPCRTAAILSSPAPVSIFFLASGMNEPSFC